MAVQHTGNEVYMDMHSNVLGITSFVTYMYIIIDGGARTQSFKKSVLNDNQCIQFSIVQKLKAENSFPNIYLYEKVSLQYMYRHERKY